MKFDLDDHVPEGVLEVENQDQQTLLQARLEMFRNMLQEATSLRARESGIIANIIEKMGKELEAPERIYNKRHDKTYHKRVTEAV